MQVAYDVEREAEGHRPTYASLWNVLSRAANTDLASFDMAQGIVMTGPDLSHTTAADQLECRQACKHTAACVTWTFHSGSCHLKQQYAPPLQDPAFWSGLQTTVVLC